MNRPKFYVFLFLLGFSLLKVNAQEYMYTSQIVEKLSLEDKERIVVGSEMENPWNPDQDSGVGETEDKVPGAAGTSLPIELLGNKKVVFADGPAGIRISSERASSPDQKFYATAFPVATMLASTFNLELINEVGDAFGREGKEFGVDILLSPALNIHRNPLGGRNFEYYSEDPYLSGKMAASFTKGVQDQGIGVSLKHFSVNNQETNRQKVNVIVGQRALREIYLRGFEIAVKESEPWTVMSAYNKVNGEFASESKELLTVILRDEWGFDGFVMTDWFAGDDIIKQLKAGNDLLMPGTSNHKGVIVNAVKEGLMKEEELNGNVSSILNIYKKTPTFLGYKPSGKPDRELSKKIAQKATEEGIVLLKNENNSLPIANSSIIALFGNASYETIPGGTGSGDVNNEYSISIAQGFSNNNLEYLKSLETVYDYHIKTEKSKQVKKEWSFGPDELIPEKKWSKEEIDSIAKNSDIGFFTINRTSGEFEDRKQGFDFYLSQNEKELLSLISESYRKQGKKFIVLLNIGGVIETASWKDFADAILLIWQPGQEGGNAVANIINGKVSPSGKLPMTFPDFFMDHYSSKNFPGRELEDNPYPNFFTGTESEVIYEEGIYVGYRYFDTFEKEVSFPFGFGLSYTEFGFSDLETEINEAVIDISCTITNTGKVKGKEVVQVYISSSQGELEKPEKELRSFKKTKLLQPGEKQSISFSMNPKDYASYDPDANAWILEPGTYKVLIGNSSRNISLQAEFEIKEKILVLKTSNSLEINREVEFLSQKR